MVVQNFLPSYINVPSNKTGKVCNGNEMINIEKVMQKRIIDGVRDESGLLNIFDGVSLIGYV